MDLSFLVGLVGSIILVTGAAWPDAKKPGHPARSLKNWLFTAGSACMFVYAVLGFLSGGSIFFVFLQILIALATTVMMLNVSDRHGSPVIALGGAGLIIWSLFLFQDYTTLVLIAGLITLALGYVFQTATLRRGIALTLGSMLVALFSFIEANWIFFWLNVFFAIFSAYYVLIRAVPVYEK